MNDLSRKKVFMPDDQLIRDIQSCLRLTIPNFKFRQEQFSRNSIRIQRDRAAQRGNRFWQSAGHGIYPTEFERGSTGIWKSLFETFKIIDCCREITLRDLDLCLKETPLGVIWIARENGFQSLESFWI